MSAANFDAQRETLWQAWLDLEGQADDALLKGAAHYFKCIRQSACDALALEALASARLGQSDEVVFDHLVRLMETYREIISLFGGSIKSASPELVAGLCDILCSRLKQFEDDAIGQGNPVVKEKHAILEKAILKTAQQIEAAEEAYAASPIGESAAPPPVEAGSSAESAAIDSRKSLLTGGSDPWQALRESILEKTLPIIYTHYTQNLQACLSNIDDLHTRKTASYYTDLLEREWEVLGLIIQVQVKAIESAFEAVEESPQESPENQPEQTLHSILSKLREAYQQTGPIVSGLRKMMQAANPSRPLQISSYECFARVIASNITPLPPIDIDNQAFMAGLLPEADIIFEGLRTGYLERINDLQLGVTGDISLADKVVAIFKKAGEELASLQSKPAEPEMPTIPEESEEPPADEHTVNTEAQSSTRNSPIAEAAPVPKTLDASEETAAAAGLSGISEEAPANHHIENQILSGISETLEIKVESLAESLQTFTENSMAQLASIPKGIPVLTEESLITSASQILLAWSAAPPALDNLADFLAECVSLDAFAAYDEQLAKHISNASAKIEKISLRFKKETLLYEISTYEEILFHSVSRLRESALPRVAAAVCLLDETFSNLESLLTESGITVIRPATHEPFNGREHEVLVAEEADGFAKGEIIKVMTSGYKLKDQVILRANVIAAR